MRGTDERKSRVKKAPKVEGPDRRSRDAEPRRPDLLALTTGLTVTLAAVLVVVAARGDLWLDEIWSVMFARRAGSALDVIRHFHHDNNHPLNSIYLHLLGDRNSLLSYRLLSILSGIGSLWIVARLARRRWGRPEALVGLILLGSSYPLLLYFSEARGYAPAILFGLAATAILEGHLRRSRRWSILLFWSASVLGLLAHASFMMLTLAFLAWSLAAERKRRSRPGPTIRRLGVLHAPPLIFFAGWYLYFFLDMVIGTGPKHGLLEVAGQAAAMVLGFPDRPGFRGAAILLVIALTCLGSLGLRRRGDPSWALYPTVLILSPALLMITVRPEYPCFRYFVIGAPHFLLLMAYLAVRYYRLLPRTRRWWVPAALILVLAGQTPRIGRLLRYGRGDYSAALEYIAGTTPDRLQRIGSDQDFRNGMLFDFYAPRVPGGDRLRYVPQSRWAEEPPDWIVTHSQDPAFHPPDLLEAGDIGIYSLVRHYPFAGISGWSWSLFRPAALAPGCHPTGVPAGSIHGM